MNNNYNSISYPHHLCPSSVSWPHIAQNKLIMSEINVKWIQARQFQNDQENSAVRILQMDFAMNYSCEYQDESLELR